MSDNTAPLSVTPETSLPADPATIPASEPEFKPTINRIIAKDLVYAIGKLVPTIPGILEEPFAIEEISDHSKLGGYYECRATPDTRDLIWLSQNGVDVNGLMQWRDRDWDRALAALEVPVSQREFRRSFLEAAFVLQSQGVVLVVRVDANDVYRSETLMTSAQYEEMAAFRAMAEEDEESAGAEEETEDSVEESSEGQETEEVTDGSA